MKGALGYNHKNKIRPIRSEHVHYLFPVFDSYRLSFSSYEFKRTQQTRKQNI